MPIDLDPAELWITWGALGLSFGIVVWMVLLERRPRETFKPRLVPTTPIMLAFCFIGLLALVHLVNLHGIVTGRTLGP